MSSSRPLSPIIVPKIGCTLADDQTLLQWSEDEVILLAVPSKPEALAAEVDTIRSLLDGVTNTKLFFISDETSPSQLDPSHPTLFQLQQKFTSHVLQNISRDTVHRFMAALEYARHGGEADWSVCAAVTEKFADEDCETLWHKAVATYDRRLAQREKEDAYAKSVRKLHKLLTTVKGLHVGIDLEGTLVGRYRDSQHPLASLSYVRRPFANELLEGLSRDNTVTIISGASRRRIALILAETKLHVPDDVAIISAEDILIINRGLGLDDDQVKVLDASGIDLLVDDNTQLHIDRARKAGLTVNPSQFIPVRTHNYGLNALSLVTRVEEIDLVTIATEIAKRATRLQSR